MIGGEGGNGILLVRDGSKGWSQPRSTPWHPAASACRWAGQSSETVFTIMSDKALKRRPGQSDEVHMATCRSPRPDRQGHRRRYDDQFSSDAIPSLRQPACSAASFSGAGILKKDEWNHAYYGPNATPYGIVIERKFQNPNC